jgi:hypothetical protein
MRRISGRPAGQARRRPFTGRLLKRIDPGDAKARGLRGAFAAPPDSSDVLAFVECEVQARWRELDKFFDLHARQSDIWRVRALALIEYEFGIQPDDPRWWERLATGLAVRHVLGFYIKKARDKKHGAPLEWDQLQLAELFADIEFLKKSTGKRVGSICAELQRKEGYAARWGLYKKATLQKAYRRAAALGLPIEAAINRHALKPNHRPRIPALPAHF